MLLIILGAIALGTAAIGAKKGTEGFAKMNEAKEIGERAQRHHERAVKHLKEDWEATNKLADEYGQLQLDVLMRTIGRFVAFIERIGQRNKLSEKEFLEGLDGISVQQLQEYKAAVVEAEEAFKGVFSAVGAGAVGLAQAIGTVSVAKFFGLFTTEVAVSQLGGAGSIVNSQGIPLTHSKRRFKKDVFVSRRVAPRNKLNSIFPCLILGLQTI